jgi:hypothetical protein
MTLCRCLENHSWPEGKNANKYVAYVFPIGYPDTAAICPLCQRAGIIWLTEEEAEAFASGQRVFKMLTHSVWLKADDRPIVRHK